MAATRVRHNPPRYRIGRGEEPDPIAVQHCLAGDINVTRLTTADRRQVVATLAQRGLSDREIADRLRWSGGDRGRWAVCAFRRRHRIPSARTAVRREGADQRAEWWINPATKEGQIRVLAGLGLTDRQIGGRAGVDPKTVWAYRNSRGIPPGRPRRGSRP